MNWMSELHAALVQNLMFSCLLGLPAVGFLVRRRQNLLLHGLLTAIFCTLCAAGLFLIRPLFRFSGGKFWLPAVSVLLIAAVCGLLYLPVHFRGGKHRRALTVQIFTAGLSSAVLGMLIQSVDAVPNVLSALRRGALQGAGYLTACMMLQAVLPLLNSVKMPRSLRGVRGVYLCAGVLAMAAALLGGS